MTRVQVSVLVENGFVATELALVQDVLRIATRLGRVNSFDLQVCTTADSDLVEALGGMMVRAVPLPLQNAQAPDHLIVLGGAGIGARFLKLLPRLRWCQRMGQEILLMSDAAFEWQKLNTESDQIATHWEDQQVRSMAICESGGSLPLYTRTGRVTTAAGMISAADVILGQIVAPRSTWLAQAVGNVLLIDRIRNGATRQPRSENDVNALRLVRLETAIAAMEENLDYPLPIAELAAIANVSTRQFERKFKFYLGQSPGAFYRLLRLRRAQTLIEQTALPVYEISVACGFGSPQNFSKLYASTFGITPSRRRAQLSANAAPHRSISHSQGFQNAPVPLSTR